MADETVQSDQIQQRPHKRKHTHDLQSKNRKKWKLPHARGQVKREKSQSVHLGFPKTAAEMSSNWKILQATLQKERKKAEEKGEVKHRSRKTFKTRLEPSESSQKAKSEIWFDDVDPEDLKQATGSKTVETTTGNENLQKTLITGNMEQLTKRIALDCEMVGIGTGGRKHMLARVSVVNSHGHAVYDSFVAPQEKVVDYRTSVSGVRPADLRNAPDFKTVQFNVSKLLKGRILVGHSLKNDLAVLFLGHPGRDIRDTAKYRPFQEKLKSRMPSLRNLAKHFLNINIQQGEHSSVQDAQAAMRLYMLHKTQWEKYVKDAKFKHFKTQKTKTHVTRMQMT